MNTSYFSKSSKHPNAVSIAGKSPSWYNGRIYRKLAPKYSSFMLYKNNKDEELFIKNYYEEVLNKLNPNQVFEELGEHSVLLCWETSDKFCHRHIVAEWLSKNLNISVTEL